MKSTTEQAGDRPRRYPQELATYRSRLNRVAPHLCGPCLHRKQKNSNRDIPRNGIRVGLARVSAVLVRGTRVSVTYTVVVHCAPSPAGLSHFYSELRSALVYFAPVLLCCTPPCTRLLNKLSPEKPRVDRLSPTSSEAPRSDNLNR